MGTIVFPRPYQAEELRRVKASTLLLIGQQEALFDAVTAIARARQLIPKIQAELIPQAGHEMPISKPEVVNKQVLEFLKE